MEGGEGMVAVVRGMRDSGLAVTLLDGSRQYTLMPNACEGKTSPPPQVHIAPHLDAPPMLPPHAPRGPHMSALPQCPHQAQRAPEMSGDHPPRCDSGSQATDGRYASMYKMAHCSVTPTSPPVQLTEFPPQRAELCRGHGNFEVGGSGSGENYVPSRSGAFRGGMSWPDRGSVCSPRPSREPDAFANSLRKYPNLSVERSTEMVERLITYTQAKNLSKSYQNRYPSPSRHVIESNASNQLVLDRSSSRNTMPRFSYQRTYEPEVRIKPREESPTRDMRNDCGCSEYRRAAERCLSVAKKPYNQTGPGIRCDHSSPGNKTPSTLTATNSVNMEVQAAAEMVSREVATVPRAEPVRRNVAVPLSRSSSSDEQKREATSLVTNNFTVQLCGNIQTFMQNSPGQRESPNNIKSVQTSFSLVDLATEKCSHCQRKIKSQEDIRNENRDVQLQNEVLEWLKETYSMKPAAKLWGEKMQKLAQKLKKPGGEERIRQKIQKYLKRVPSQFSECDEERREFREQLPDNIIKKLKKMYLKPEKRRHYNTSPVRIFRIEVPKYENHSRKYDESLKLSVGNWLNEIPMKKRDFLGRTIRKEDVLESVVRKIEPYILSRHNFDKDYKETLKFIILDILNEMPVDINEYDKISHLNHLAASIVNDIVNLDTNDNYDIQNNHNVRQIETFVTNEIETLMNKLHLSISTKRLVLLENELKDALIRISANISEVDIDSATKENVFIILHNLGGISNYQANYFTDIILKHFKEEFNNKRNKKSIQDILCQSNSFTVLPRSETYSVFHNVGKIKSNIKTSSHDRRKGNGNIYKQQIMEQIEEWLISLDVQIPLKKGAREGAVKDLAEDVIDRFKYLELSPPNRDFEENELQYLKYQIFKWINKVTGENTMETIDHADDLMNRIHAVNARVLTRPKESYIQPSTSAIKTDPLTYEDQNSFSLLNGIIGNWLSELPNVSMGINSKKELVIDLANNLKNNIRSFKNIESVISKEVDRWTNKITKVKNLPKEKLKEKLRGIFSSIFSNVDSKREKVCTRKYEDIIDEWMDSVFFEMFGETLDYKNRNDHIHDFAMKSFETLNNSKSTESKANLENIALEWLEKLPLRLCIDKKDFQKECVSKLVEALLSDKQSEENQTMQEHGQQTNINIACSDRNNAKELILEVQGQNNNIIGNNQPDVSDISLYSATLPSTSKDKTINTGTDIRETKEVNTVANIQSYLKQLVAQIDEWLITLKIPQIHDRGFREIVVNDLARDIIDRHKYLELNPPSRGTDENELEQLRYQIFKWINKLVGENQQETVEKAPDLMSRIRSIPVPMMVKPSEQNCSASCFQWAENKKVGSKSSTSKSNQSGPNFSVASQMKTNQTDKNTTNRNVIGEIANVRTKTAVSSSSVRLSSPLGFTTGPMANTSQVNQVRSISPKRPGDSATEAKSSSNHPQCTSDLCPYEESNDQSDLPLDLPLDDVYPHYDNIFKQRVQEIPLDTPTPEQEMLADLARKGLYNGIWKTYFQLKANPDIENDYSYFELLFEEQLDNMLDCLPQTEEIQKTTPGWKSKLISDVMAMLKYVHSLTDTASFRQKIAEKFDRKFVKAQYQESSNLHQHNFVVRTADAYIIYSKYKEEDPIKANIYRQRLMKRIEELAEAVKSQTNVEFRYLNQAQLCQMAMQLLESVPVPQDEVLKEEADEILMGEEIDQWYNALPVIPIRNETDEVLRKRMRELLAKKLCELDKANNIDDSVVEMDMKHEVSKFLHDKAELKQNEDLNIDFMIEELTNRLKTRKQQNMLGYESFEKEKPVSSSFVQTDPSEALAPLVDIGVYEDQANQSLPHGQGFQTSQVAGPSGQGYVNHSQPRPIGLMADPGPAYDSRLGNQVDRRSVSGGLADVSLVRSSGLCQPGQGSARQGNIASAVPDRSVMASGAMAPCSHPPCQAGQGFGQVPDVHVSGENQNGQVFGQAHLSGQQGPSTAFVSRDPSPTGATRSTARVASPTPEVMDEELNEQEEVRYKCRCMERVWKCKRRHYCEDMGMPRCYPMPFPCRYFY